MLRFLNNADAAIVVLHEIYGVNEHMQSVCKHFSRLGYDVICPNLLDRDDPYDYEEETVAYQDFVNLGFPHAAKRAMDTLEALRDKYRKLYIVGYSVGATTAWLCAQRPGVVGGVVGYYGSRIRDYLDHSPQCPVLLLFPAEEASFDVDALMDKLGEMERVTVRKYEGLHGFSDPQNKHCTPLAAQQALDDTIRFLSSLDDQAER